MEKTWDNSLSTLINSHPQAFLDLLLPGAVCLHHHRTKLSGTQRQPDAVLEVERYDETFIFNPEFQSAQDKKMAERLLLYHLLLWDEFQRKDEYKELAIRTCVLALFERAKIPASPLLWTQPGEPPGQTVERIRFSYEVIQMWEKRPEDILNLGHAVLYTLLPLTKGGANQQIVTLMFDLLSGEQYRNYAVIGYQFATHTFKLLNQLEDLRWLERKFLHMQDFLSESPAYQWIETKGREEEKAQGRQTVVEIVQERFPELAKLAEDVVATIDNLPQLVRLSAKIGGAHSAEEACEMLSELAQ